MSLWWDGLTLLQKLLYFVAVPSTIVMLIQTVLLIIGMGGHMDVDAGQISGDVGHDLPHDAVVTGHSTLGHAGHITALAHPMTDVHASHGAQPGDDSASVQDAAAFRLFSLRSVLAFLVVFGWVGIAMDAGTTPVYVTMLVAFVCGSAALYLTALLFFAIQKLQSSGNIQLSNAVGSSGEVYIPIPASGGGTGKVNVLVQERWLECDAITPAGGVLKTGQPVRVTGVQGNSVLVVEPVQPEQ